MDFHVDSAPKFHISWQNDKWGTSILTCIVWPYFCSRDGLVQAVELDLFAVNDEKFMDMFVAPGAIDVLQNEKQSLEKRQKILLSCLTEFKCVAQAL